MGRREGEGAGAESGYESDLLAVLDPLVSVLIRGGGGK